ncbi:putative NADH:ubiquinone oxidoreductase 17.8 kDa subunit precursor [Dunaliella salina]|uniref:NADH:ubiquinone oxidoreductase 17.8 kDa subunit n=1 Tax=Dunaliella salina TaxID=3046 RepID=A0ABQ7GR01_DUNSA|nr:putative NADH:ubiquinone oxidoreductase 17.8 kDa subunit precursor [Dunaliella salina]|eukprot:KAF5836987.1 putative NADH:ubiquinone oxidoreductase 17.8 kDa subunit precursor [Dunaliella salina]
MDTAWANKVRGIWESAASTKGERWARPAEPILHDMEDEKAEPTVFFHNTNYRISRKYINIEKVKMLKEEALKCVRAEGSAKYHKCMEIYKRLQAAVRVSSNVDRGPLARKRDVAFIYHTNKMNELQKQAAELEVPFPFYAPPKSN